MTLWSFSGTGNVIMPKTETHLLSSLSKVDFSYKPF